MAKPAKEEKMSRELIGVFDPGEVPDDDATDEEIEAWADAMADALFDSPVIKKLNQKKIKRD